jgi:DNA-binding transcriptional MerR regulator
VPRKVAAEPAAEKMYRSISEVSELLDVKPHVLRYWETQFSTLRPRKNRAGNRMYRPDEIKLLYAIKDLLYGRRFTIEGAKRSLQAEKKAPSGQLEMGFKDASRKVLIDEIRSELVRLAAQLKDTPAKRRVLKA